MRASRKASVLVLLAIAAVLAAALAVAGCGGSSSGGGGGEPASLAPESSLVYIEANLAPEAKVSEQINAGAGAVLPEPASMALLGTGLLALGALRRRRRG